jgi:hypothetical protein
MVGTCWAKTLLFDESRVCVGTRRVRERRANTEVDEIVRSASGKVGKSCVLLEASWHEEEEEGGSYPSLSQEPCICRWLRLMTTLYGI